MKLFVARIRTKENDEALLNIILFSRFKLGGIPALHIRGQPLTLDTRERCSSDALWVVDCRGSTPERKQPKTEHSSDLWADLILTTS